MVMSVSNAAPQKKIGVMDKISQEQLNSLGKYSSSVIILESPQAIQTYRKSGGFLRFLGKLVLLTAAICGGAVLMRKKIPSMQKDVLDASGKVDSKAKITDKAKFYIAKVADFVEAQAKDIFGKKPKSNPSNASKK